MSEKNMEVSFKPCFTVVLQLIACAERQSPYVVY